MDSLTRSEFEVLYALSCAHIPLTQRQLHEKTQISLGRINTAVRICEQRGYIANKVITDAGRAALAPYRVNNAIIMAAGLSQRFAPISYERPKGTLRVRGEILIERQIRQLIEAGITDITIVVGYKKEYFFYLAKKFGVKLVINDEYATRNNNGSLWRVRDQLANTYICSSDDYFTENPFESHVYQAYYSAQYVEGPTQEWCITTGPGDRITGATIGGHDSWTMLGHVYFDREFSRAFCRILDKVYDLPRTVPQLWESIYLDHIKDLHMVIRRYPAGMINEFDSVDELRNFDPLFMENIDSEVFHNISSVLHCPINDIHDIFPLKQGVTNLSCHFSLDGKEYVYRHPGTGTSKLVDRQAEFEAMHLAADLGLDSTFISGDPDSGWKISRYIPHTRNLDPENPEELAQAMRMARTLHNSGKTLSRSFDFISESFSYERVLEQHGPIDLPEYAELREKILRLKTQADNDDFPHVPCHNDFYPPNFLIETDNTIHLIDWEYAGMSDVASDFGTLVVCTRLCPDKAQQALRYYFDRIPTHEEMRHFWAYVVFAGWCWYVWALAKEAEGDDVGEWLLTYYSYAATYIDDLLAWYENDSSDLPDFLTSDSKNS
ncbi:phosphotransferase [Schaalia sp. lx-100]|uniref:phosphotransferase n=1 Tax=Schaalia sp. lx-100 TaxID=2899081 RepID=UPI001E5E49E5|nr:phosphotransferase [Schaalia sp. lx-100]MCD4556758.1 phosphocholine cytidylyltransferase/choline kinase family protein [Schaalia sp. lx-100]